MDRKIPETTAEPTATVPELVTPTKPKTASVTKSMTLMVPEERSVSETVEEPLGSTSTTPVPPTRFAGISLEDVKAIVREELRVLAERLLQEQVEKEIDEKISDKRISNVKRTKIHKKVLDTARKQLLENDLIEKIVAEQTEKKHSDEDTRISDDITLRLRSEIETQVQRCMEKAIADEIFEKVKIENLSKTPTVQPKLGAIGVRHGQAFMVLLFLAISFIQRVDISVAIVALKNSNEANPDYRDFNWDEKVQSLLLSSFYLFYSFVQLPGGILAEKYGPKLVMTCSMLICATLSLLMPAATLMGGWLGLFMLKLLQGVSQGTFIPAVYVFTSRWIPPKEKSKLFTPAFGGMQLGTVVGMPISGFLCASYFGWPSVFFFSAIVGYLWVVVWIFVAANSPSVHRSISREEQLYIEGSFGFGQITIKGAKKTIPWRDILTCKPFIALMICHFGENWAYTTLLTEMPVYMNDILDVEITNNALLSAMTYLVGWILIVIFGFMAAFFREKQLCSLTVERKIWSSVAMYGSGFMFFVIAIIETDDVNTLIILLTITIAINSAIYNGVFSNHADLSPNYVGILMGLSNSLGNLSSLLAPLFVGFVVKESTNKSQWAIVFYTSAGVVAICNTVLLVFGSSEIQPWNTPPNLYEHLTKDVLTFDSSHTQGYTVSEFINKEEKENMKHHRNNSI